MKGSRFFYTFVAMKHFGLIGRPLGHSASAAYFTKKFTLEGIDADYSLYELDSIEQVESLRGKLSGFNVTIPYKKAIIPYLATISPEAEAVGAVNCVKIDSAGRMHGYNTDVVGIRASLQGFDLRGKRALVLGTGGASAAVVAVLKQMGACVTLVSRHQSEGVITYEDITDKVVENTTIIVNATPVGMYPNTTVSPQLPYNALTDAHILFDLVYNPAQTEFLKQGLRRGATTIEGTQMFYSQAEASWSIWNSKDED